MTEQMTLDGQPVVKILGLRCYLIGDHDYYAAESAEQAIELHRDMLALDDDEDIGECVEVVGKLLDVLWDDEEGNPAGTLRQWLAEATEPEWIAGTE